MHDPARARRARHRRAAPRVPPGCGCRRGDRHRSRFVRRDRGRARALRARRPRPCPPRAGRPVSPARVGDAHGATRRDRARGRLGDLERRRRVLVAPRRYPPGGPRLDPSPLRARAGRSSAISCPVADDGAAVPGANDPAALRRRHPSTTRAAPGGPSARSSTALTLPPRSSRAATRSVAPASSRYAAGTRSRCSTSRSARPRSSSARARSGKARRRSSTPREEVVAGPGAAYHALAYRDSRSGRSAERFARARGCRAGARRGTSHEACSPRTRGFATALRRLGESPEAPLAFPRPTAADDAAFAVDAAVLGEADLVRIAPEARRAGAAGCRARDTRRRQARAAAPRGGGARPAAPLMRIAMTLLVRDEADIVDTWLRYHLARGVDVVLVTDHRSVDGTSDILREHAGDGRVVVRREEAEVIRQSEWMTQMSRLAATEHGADWVIPSDADEFWWPRARLLRRDPRGRPSRRFGVVRGICATSCCAPARAGRSSASRSRAVLRPTCGSPHHAQVKVAHRAVAGRDGRGRQPRRRRARACGSSANGSRSRCCTSRSGASAQLEQKYRAARPHDRPAHRRRRSRCSPRARREALVAEVARRRRVGRERSRGRLARLATCGCATRSACSRRPARCRRSRCRRSPKTPTLPSTRMSCSRTIRRSSPPNAAPSWRRRRRARAARLTREARAGTARGPAE